MTDIALNVWSVSTHFRKSLAFLIIFLFSIPSLYSQTFPNNFVKAELISEVQTVQPGDSFLVALRLEMDEHWHTYWKNPGDSGLSTKLEWELPEGFTADEVQWPYPEKFETPPLVSYGYVEDVILLVQIHAPAKAHLDRKVLLKAKVSWLACKSACLPGSAVVCQDVLISHKVKRNKKWHRLFAEARAKMPIANNEWQARASTQDSTLTISLNKPTWFQKNTHEIKELYFFSEQSEVIRYAAVQKFQKTKSGYELKVLLSSQIQGELKNIKGILVADIDWKKFGSARAMAIDLSVTAAPVVSANTEFSSIWRALLFAFIGGMILNLMPCVLPVLSLKILGFVQQAGEDKTKSVMHGLSFTGGVMLSFWILAGTLILLRTAGEQIGWGFQLQSPAFLIILSSIIYLLGLNMLGVFEIGVSMTAVGGNMTRKSGLSGSFFSGVLATVIATPCSAPFMGSALGYALAQPIFASVLIFTAIGLGMALPYMLLSSMPSLLKFVPKPGRWMESFKQFMGFLMLATVIWLVWVLSLQTGTQTVMRLLVTMLLLGFAGWVFGRWGSSFTANYSRLLGRAVAASALLAGLAFSLIAVDGISAGSNLNSDSAIPWEKYSPERVAELREAGKPFFWTSQQRGV